MRARGFCPLEQCLFAGLWVGWFVGSLVRWCLRVLIHVRYDTKRPLKSMKLHQEFSHFQQFRLECLQFFAVY